MEMRTAIRMFLTAVTRIFFINVIETNSKDLCVGKDLAIVERNLELGVL